MEEVEIRGDDVKHFLTLVERDEKIQYEKQRLIDFINEDKQDLEHKIAKVNEVWKNLLKDLDELNNIDKKGQVERTKHEAQEVFD